MSDEPIQSTDSEAPPVMHPLVAAWLVLGVIPLITAGIVGIILLFRETGWEGVWKLTLIGTCGLFAVMSVLVIVGGALDIRKLLHRLREREASGNPDSDD